jgi:endoglucanase
MFLHKERDVPRRFPAIYVPVLLILGLTAALTSAIGPVEAAGEKPLLAPEQVRGVAVYVPYNVPITIDGKLNDWAHVPVQKVSYGPQVSADYLEDGEFSFSVAADQTSFYITMAVLDKAIIAGKHGSAYWNEDSMEFYFNTSSNLDANTYGDGIYQINVNAADIGNKNPGGLTLTGVNSEKIHLRGFVFKTADGWGFEAAVPMAELGITPAHGLEIGFQAQLNGASVLDRNVQLSWSIGDKKNTSYQDPSVFGTAIFFQVGQTAIPTPARAPATPSPRPTAPPAKVSVNQVGYYATGPKIASFADRGDTPDKWSLVDSSGKEVATGMTTVLGEDTASGNVVHEIDFSAYTTPGNGYVLHVYNTASDPFKISDDIYTVLRKDALAYYYRSRSGIELLKQYAGDSWARAAGHLSDNHVTCYKGKDTSGKDWPGCDYYLDVSGGWYDAGDYGKYVVNGGISVWTLLNEYEHSPKAFGDGTLDIPENANGVPDILDEARWELKFMLGMQVPAGEELAGMVHHKMHDDQWSNMPSMPVETATNRFLFPPSTAATLNVAAVGAQCSRIWKTIDPAFSAQCLTAAETAWAAAVANPQMYAVSFAAGGGDYADTAVDDEFYWAAAELYVTTGKDVYKDYLLASPDWAGAAVPDWGNTEALGTISLSLIPNNLPGDKVKECRDAILKTADQRMDVIAGSGYREPLATFVWGSNAEALNAAMIMGLAYQYSGNQDYLDGVIETMDYLLGRNPLNISYVTGYGTTSAQHPHHRFWANQPSNGYPAPPPGVVVGGPNGNPSDTVAQGAGLTGNPPAKSYIDNIGSFSTNEVTINWNAPLAWVALFVDEAQNGGLVAPPAVKDEGLPIWLLIVVPVVLIAAGVLIFWVGRKGRRIRRGA